MLVSVTLESATEQDLRSGMARLVERNAYLEARLADHEAVVSKVAQLEADLADRDAKIAELSETVAMLTKLMVGPSSEKSNQPTPPASSDPNPTEDEVQGEDDGSRGDLDSRGRGQRRGSRGHGRRDYSNLETEEVICDVEPQDRVCGQCGIEYAPCGFEDCEQIDWQVVLRRILHRRRKYRRVCNCHASKAVVTAAVPPKPFPRSRFTAMFLARLLVEKYVLGRPLHRIGAALANDGFKVAQGTLVGVLEKMVRLLAPLEQAIWERNAAQSHLHVDETSWRVFAQVEGKVNHRWWLWAFIGTDTTVFRIEQSRSTRVLAEHLGIDLDADSLPEGRTLVVSSDFFAVYQRLAKIDGIDPLWCWAHLRRYFIRAADAHPELATWAELWLERIGALYATHAQITLCSPDTPEHEHAAQQFDASLETINQARLRQDSYQGLHRRARKVLDTFNNQWDGLARHTQFPELPLDNNTAERALRGPVIGRKNYYGSGSVWSSQLAARTWSITATATQAGLNPLTYIHDYLQACALNRGRPPDAETLKRFLPWNASPQDLKKWAATPNPTSTLN